jgi:hypothetical protein
VRISYFVILIHIFVTVLSGCAAVEWKDRHPAVKDGSPHGIVDEKNLKCGDIVSRIRGFCSRQEDYPNDIVSPIAWDYSTGQTVAKVVFTVTPWGLMTLPFANLTGRHIAVPPGELGIVVQHRYHKTIEHKVLATLSAGERYQVRPDKLTDKNLTSLLERRLEGGDSIIKHVHETCEWEDVTWITIQEGNKYLLDFCENSITGPGGKIALGDGKRISIPRDISPIIQTDIVREASGAKLGNHAYFDTSGNLIIEDDNGIAYTFFGKMK